jgi:hypothetical protein
MKTVSKVLAGTVACLAYGSVHAQTLETIAAAPGETLVATIHAQGAQIYECKPNASNALVWQFREPVATLLENGKTVGRHYAGPHWELADGSIVAAKVTGRAPGKTQNDIPLLKLQVTQQSGSGRLTDVTTIQRVNTQGGMAEGPCTTAGTFLSVSYATDYVFYRAGETTGSRFAR